MGSILQSDNTLIAKANNSFKWTAIAELFSKILSLITNMVLAHFILPEVFGVVASLTVIISFAELFSEAGFSRFLVQKNVSNEETFKKYVGTANLSTIVISLLIFLVILIFRNPLASLANADGFGLFLAISSIQIPLYGFSSIQTAIAKRYFEYGKIAFVRICSIVIRFGVSITLAIIGLKFEALIYGAIISAAFQTVVFIVMFWKYFSIKFSISSFREMIGVSSLYFLETFLSWLNSSLDVFLLAFFFDQTTTGLYKNALTTSSGFISVFTAIYTSVMVSLLSRTQDNDKLFNSIIYKYQRLISYFLIPFGLGVLIYRDFLTELFFGEGWEGAALILGVFTLSDCFGTCTGQFVMNAFTSKGKPIFNVFINLIGLAWIGFSFAIAKLTNFEMFVIVRSLRNVIMALFACLIGKHVLRIRISPIIKNLILPIVFCIPFLLFGIFQTCFFTSSYALILGIVLCLILYFSQFVLIAKEDALDLIKVIRGKPLLFS